MPSSPRGGSRRLAIASAAFLSGQSYYTKSAVKFGENEAKADCGLATKNRRFRSISYLSCFFCPLWLKQTLHTVSRCIAAQRPALYGGLGLTVRAAALPSRRVRPPLTEVLTSPHDTARYCLAISTPADVNRRSFIAAPPSVQASCRRPF